MTENTLKTKLLKWNQTLSSGTYYDQTLQDIFRFFNNPAIQLLNVNESELLSDLLANIQNVFRTALLPLTKVLAYRVYYQLSFKTEAYDDNLLQNNLAALHGMLFSNTNYYTRLDQAKLLDSCLANFEIQHFQITESSYKYLTFALETILKVLDLTGYSSQISPRLWRLVCLHIDTQQKRTKDLVLLIFAHVITDKAYLKDTLLPELLTKFTWLNRNKYDLLTVLLSKYRYGSLLYMSKNMPHLRPEMFFKGLTLALKYKHLLAPSQNLAKVLNEDPIATEYLIPTAIDVIKYHTSFEVQNLVTFWAKSLNASVVYQEMNLRAISVDELAHSVDYEYLRWNGYQNLIFLRHMLAAVFVYHEKITAIDSIIIEHGLQHPNLYTRQLVYDVLLKNLMTNGHENHFQLSLDNFNRFLALNINTEDAALRNFILNKFPLLLQHLIKKNQLSAVHSLSEIILNGDYERYQEIMVRLRMLDIFFNLVGKTKSGSTKVRAICQLLSLSVKAEEKFKNLLDHLIENLLISKYDDVQELMMRLIEKHLLGEGIFKLEAEQLRMRCLEYAGNGNLDSPQYTRIWVLGQGKTGDGSQFFSFFTELDQKLRANFNAFTADPLQAIIQGNQLFGLTNCMHELLLAGKDNTNVTEIILRNEMENQSETVVYELLKMLNVNETGPTFEVMESSLKKLVQESVVESVDPWIDEKILLKSIWLSLKAMCEYSATLAKHLLRNPQYFNNPLIQLKKTLTVHKSVLIRCCHKGAIEAAGNSLGTIIRCLTESRNNNPSSSFYNDLISFVKIELIDHITCAQVGRIEMRSARGLCIMFHQISKNDVSSEHVLLYYCLTKVLPIFVSDDLLTVISEKNDGELTKFYESCQPLHQIQLTALIKDAELTERLLPFMGMAMQLAFEKFKSNNWAATQLYGVTCLKLAHQKQSFVDDENDDWVPTQIAFDDLFTKFPKLWTFIVQNAGQQKPLDILILDFLSHFEYRDICMITDERGNQEYRQLYDQISAKNWCCSKINWQLRKFQAQFEKLLDLPEKVELYVESFLSSRDADTKMSYLHAITFSLRKYEANERHICEYQKSEFFENLRKIFQNPSNTTFSRNMPYFVRLKLLDLLLHIGFIVKDTIVVDLVEDGPPGTVITVGWDLWQLRIEALKEGQAHSSAGEIKIVEI